MVKSGRGQRLAGMIEKNIERDGCEAAKNGAASQEESQNVGNVIEKSWQNRRQDTHSDGDCDQESITRACELDAAQFLDSGHDGHSKNHQAHAAEDRLRHSGDDCPELWKKAHQK